MSHTYCLLYIPSPCTNKCHIMIPHSLSISVHPIESTSFSPSLPVSSAMAQEVQKPRITEIQVRMDCNGCVQKIKRALHGINGIYDLYIDLPQQKITIVGWAEPEKIVKAIKKTRKSAIICSHTEPADPPAQPAEPAPDQGEAPASESENPPPVEAPPPAEAAPPAEPPKDPPPPPPEAKPSTDQSTADAAPSQQPAEPTRPKDVEEVHVIYHYPPDYGYGYNYANNISHGYAGHTSTFPSGQAFRTQPPPPLYGNNISSHGYAGQTSTYPSGPAFRPEPPPPLSSNNISHGYSSHTSTYPSGPASRPETPPQPLYATHSYNTHRPSPYVTQYEYIRPPPPPQYTQYSRPVPYSEDFHYHNGNNNSSGNITSVFSDENPNACTIV